MMKSVYGSEKYREFIEGEGKGNPTVIKHMGDTYLLMPDENFEEVIDWELIFQKRGINDQ